MATTCTDHDCTCFIDEDDGQKGLHLEGLALE
jgi:hypothetical protein